MPLSFWSKSKGKKAQSPVPEMDTLFAQFPTPASSSTKIRLSILSTAMVDALGGPAEFQQRFSFPFVSSMLPNDTFKLPPGVWTDDTSMTLCLAKSLCTFKESPNSPYTGGFDEVHQLQLYKRWHEEGHLSAVGRCFDIGNGIRTALDLFNEYEEDPEQALLRIRCDLSDESKSGNGSLMRITPIGLAYWRDNSEAKVYARRSSQATHPSAMCLEVCEMWTGAIGLIMKEATQPPKDLSKPNEGRFSKLCLLEYISNYPYANNKLRESLALPFGVPPRPERTAERENWYFRYHPLLRLIAETQSPAAVAARSEPSFSYNIPTAEQLPSSGFVLHSAVAALYCFFSTQTFEDGALMAVNLGNDADTVGAIYAGLAGCWYAAEEGKAEGLFWTKRVKGWKQSLVRRSMVEEIAESLVVLERKLAEE
ncbi:hypothetical protein GALMADRAFT_246811 [Galerina marginata CBS 339.88]|uniref:ADP-ribosylhydrolase ARH3 n=1 Tax=Galerina marginata (strain CBS 339.88) TaxID=685588 RepID=A0A067T025_GALM3|nr:hypothetical protein GALMADRAFT_246811 [Galerina marginata CBS 339.88]